MSETLYRKWRPKSFAELAGQDHVATTLRNALGSGRIAHAYLFAGPRGTGKTSSGRLLAKALNCRQRAGGEPCNQCQSCQDYLSGRALDLIELDAASNRGIDEIRSLRDKVAFAPGAGEFKVYLIDEVHMLTDAAFNALLKTLEEPPPHVVFILATTDAHKVPATITSRCQRFDFRRIPLNATVATLQTICAGEGIECEEAALELIARAATGSLRDATNLLDQLATSYGRSLSLEHVRGGLGLIGDARAGELALMALRGDLAGGLQLIGGVRDDGLDLRQFQRELVEELRNLLLVKNGLDPADGVTAERRAEMAAAVKDVAMADLLRALRAFGEADLKQDPESTLPLDIALADCLLGEAAAVIATPQPTSRPAAAPTPAPQSVRVAPPTPGPQTPAPVVREREAVALSPGPLPQGEGATPSVVQSDTDLAAARPIASPASTLAASTPVAAGLAAAQEQMRAIYDRARVVRPKLAALLNGGCDIIEADETRLVFGFKYPRHPDMVNQSENAAALKSVVAEVMGRPLEVVCVYRQDAESWKDRGFSRNPLVRAAQEMGARVVASQPEDLR